MNAPFQGMLAPGIFNENPAHCLGGRGKEVAFAIPLLVSVPREAQPGFMNERGRLQSLPGGFVRHPGSGQPAQLSIDQRQ